MPIPGEVLALLTPMQDLAAGLYVVRSVADGWTLLRGVYDDERNEQLIVTDRRAWLPTELIEFFMPIGIRLAVLD